MARKKKEEKKIQSNSIKDNLSPALYSALVSRAQLMSRLGQQYGNDRDLYQALGYVLNPTYDDYAAQYDRQDIAKAIIDKPAKSTWRGGLKLEESSDNEATAFETAWDELSERLKLSSCFLRLDKLTGLGEYGVLLLGFDDVTNSTDWQKQVTGTRKLVYVKPLSQGSAQISTYDKNTNSVRFGLPETYNLTVTEEDSSSTTITVHWSRVIHVIDGQMESEVTGIPRLKPVFNRLMDIEKIVGGSGEMFWRGARPGYHGKVDKDYQVTTETQNDLRDQIDEYEHNLRRILVNDGIDFKALEMQIADPASHLDVQVQMVSSETGIPKRILTGSERGELSSGQDRVEWLSLIQERREIFAEPNIVRPFVERMVQYKVLPAYKDSYTVKWSDLFAPSEKDKAEVGKTRATALKEYTTNPAAESVLPQGAFFRYILNLPEADIELIEKMKQAAMEEEADLTEEEQDLIGEEQE